MLKSYIALWTFFFQDHYYYFFNGRIWNQKCSYYIAIRTLTAKISQTHRNEQHAHRTLGSEFWKKSAKNELTLHRFLQKKGWHNKIASLQQFFIALFSPYLDHYSAARPVPIVIRPIVVLVTLSHISRSTCLRVQQLSKISNSRHVPGMVCYESKMPSVASSCYEGKFRC